MNKKRYIKPAASMLLLKTSDNVMIDFPFFTQSVNDGLGKKNDMTVVDDEEEEMENDSVKYSPSYKRYKPFDDWKGTVLDW
jgi:hypothetical protein